MNILLITLILITFTSSDAQVFDFKNTEPYVEFDWLDEDKKSLKIELNTDVTGATIYCYLYNNTHYCPGTGKCEITYPRVITCEFEGDKCKADGDNPATKFYYKVLCSGSSYSDFNAFSANLANLGDPYITVAVKGGSYIKFSFILLLSLLVL